MLFCCYTHLKFERARGRDWNRRCTQESHRLHETVAVPWFEARAARRYDVGNGGICEGLGAGGNDANGCGGLGAGGNDANGCFGLDAGGNGCTVLFWFGGPGSGGCAAGALPPAPGVRCTLVEKHTGRWFGGWLNSYRFSGW